MVTKPPTIVKKEQLEPEDEQTLISKGLLKKLYSELKRMKQIEKEYLASREGKIIPNEIYEEREIKSDNLQEYLIIKFLFLYFDKFHSFRNDKIEMQLLFV